MGRLIATLLLVGLASPAAARLRVCTLAFNGPEEVDVFRTHLRPEDFEIVDLSSVLAPAPTDGTTASLAPRCPADLHCDVVVFSAEFGGHFFGRSCAPRGDCAPLPRGGGGDWRRTPPLRAPLVHAGMVRVSGLSRADSAAGDRDVVCRLYDDGAPLVDRLRVVRNIMARENALSFLPMVEAFLAEHDPATFGAEERAAFAEVQRSDGARAEVLRLVEQLDVSALRIELAQVAERLGWMTPEEFRLLASDGVRQLLARRLTSELVDVTCAITQHEPVGRAFRSADLPDVLFQRAEGLRLVACLAPPDPALNVRLLAALDGGDESVRSWAAYALTRRLPLDDATLFDLASRADDESADVRQRLRWILAAQAQPSEPVRHAHR